LDRLIRAFAEIAKAADSIRNTDKPSGALRTVAAYLIGFAIISTSANAWTSLTVLHERLPRQDVYGVASLAMIIACAPLFASIALSGSRTALGPRLLLLPLRGPQKLALAALCPLVGDAPIVAIASLLPAVAALPIARLSVADYALSVAGYATATAALAGTVRALASAAVALIVGPARHREQASHGRAIAMTVALAAIAACNPSYVIIDGKTVLAIYGSRHLPANLLGTMPASPYAVGLALATIALAMASTLLDHAVERRAAALGIRHREPRGAARGGSALAATIAIVDRKRSFLPGMAISLALGLLSVAQGASPAIPIVAALILITVRSGSALGFLAIENDTTRRFAMIPAAPGTAARTFLRAAIGMAAISAMPLVLAAAILALS